MLFRLAALLVPLLVLTLGQGCGVGEASLFAFTVTEAAEAARAADVAGGVEPAETIESSRQTDGSGPPSASPDRATLQAWADACRALATGGADAHDQARENDERCRDYQVHLVSTPGVWGDTTMLMMLGLMKGVRVAAYEMRREAPGAQSTHSAPPADANAPPPSLSAHPQDPTASATETLEPIPDRSPAAKPRTESAAMRVHFAQWLGVTESDIRVHLLNLGRGHWQAFRPSTPPSADARGDTPVEGDPQEAGGGGDCMYYAFLASMDAQEEATTAPRTYLRDRQRMVALRQEFGQFLIRHWDTPVAGLGGEIGNTLALGELSRFDEPRYPDPLGPYIKCAARRQ